MKTPNLNPGTLNLEPAAPTAAQLFGSAYNPDYINLLPEAIQFEHPVAMIPDFSRTKQLIKDFVNRYHLDLRGRYPDEPGRNGGFRKSKAYTRRQLNSGTMATLDALLEMYGGYCIAVANGINVYPAFKIRPSAVMSRRYGAVSSANTINDHLDRLEQSGLIQMSTMQHDQSYCISFNREVMAARANKMFTKTIVENILKACPLLALNKDFQEWQKRLKPSFFAVPSPGGPQFLRAYMLDKKHNSNNPSAELLTVGETAFPATPPSSTRSKGANPRSRPTRSQETPLAARNQKDEIKYQEGLSFKVERAWDIARNCFFWKLKEYTPAQVANTKRFLRMRMEDHIAENGVDSNYLADVLLPVLKNQQRSILSGKYNWRPPAPDIYFSPDFCTDDGRPAGYTAAVNAWNKITAAKKIRIGTKKKLRQWRMNEKLFIRWFEFFARIPSVKNLKKAEEQILQLNDPEITQLFYDSVISSNLVPTERLLHDIQDKIKKITNERIQKAEFRSKNNSQELPADHSEASGF